VVADDSKMENANYTVNANGRREEKYSVSKWIHISCAVERELILKVY
jgi:hypothetical protein